MASNANIKSPQSGRRKIMYNNSIESRILVYEKNGQSLKPIKIYYDSNGRKWIESRPGTKFVIEIKNNDFNTYLAVVSVDGLNVLDASKAELKPNNGYVLYGKNSMKINGWRTSLEDVREFVFTANKNDSYAHKLGADESNTGVIGLAFFREKQKAWYSSTATTWPPISPSWTYTSTVLTNSQNSYFDCSASMGTLRSCSVSEPVTKSFSMSTAQGSSVSDKVIEIDKEFEEIVSATDTIYYDSRENLIAKGILKEEEKLPEPFANTKFCPSL